MEQSVKNIDNTAGDSYIWIIWISIKCKLYSIDEHSSLGWNSDNLEVYRYRRKQLGILWNIVRNIIVRIKASVDITSNTIQNTVCNLDNLEVQR